MKISQAVALAKFCDKISQQEISVLLAYKFAKISLALANDIDFYQKQYAKYLEKYALRDGDNFVFTEKGNIKIIPGLEKECKEKFQELESMEVEAPNYFFTIHELKELKISISDMLVLEPFIIE